MNTPHKHAELIHAWADGSEIEVWNEDAGRWEETICPIWNIKAEYRIKPEPKPDIIETVAIRPSKAYGVILVASLKTNLRLVFDGETGKLKAAEVLE